MDWRGKSFLFPRYILPTFPPLRGSPLCALIHLLFPHLSSSPVHLLHLTQTPLFCIMFPPPFIPNLTFFLSSSFTPSPPWCSFVLRFNAPKQAFYVSPLRVSAGALCSPFCLCCENPSQSRLGTHTHTHSLIGRLCFGQKNTHTEAYTHTCSVTHVRIRCA